MTGPGLEGGAKGHRLEEGATVPPHLQSGGTGECRRTSPKNASTPPARSSIPPNSGTSRLLSSCLLHLTCIDHNATARSVPLACAKRDGIPELARGVFRLFGCGRLTILQPPTTLSLQVLVVIGRGWPVHPSIRPPSQAASFHQPGQDRRR